MMTTLRRWLPWIVAVYKYGKEQKWWGLNVHLEEEPDDSSRGTTEV